MGPRFKAWFIPDYSQDVTMPDTSVFGAILRDGPEAEQVAKDLEQLVDSGETVVVPWTVYKQIQRTPDPRTKALQLSLINQLGLKIQDETTMLKRLPMYGGPDPAEIDAGSRPYWTWPYIAADPAFYWRDNPNMPVGDANLGGANRPGGGVALDDLAVIADVWIYAQGPGRLKTVKFWTVERMALNPTIPSEYKIRFSLLTRRVRVGNFISPQEVFERFPSLKERFMVQLDGQIVPRFWYTKKGTAIKIGLVVGGLALAHLLGYFAAKIYQKYAKEALDEQYREIQPTIERDIKSHAYDALRIVANGGVAYAKVQISVSTISDILADQGTTTPIVRYLGTELSTVKVDKQEDDTNSSIPGSMIDKTIYTTSNQYVFDYETINDFRQYLKQVDWYQERIQATSYMIERQKLDQELMLMVGEMRHRLED